MYYVLKVTCGSMKDDHVRFLYYMSTHVYYLACALLVSLSSRNGSDVQMNRDTCLLFYRNGIYLFCLLLIPLYVDLTCRCAVDAC